MKTTEWLDRRLTQMVMHALHFTSTKRLLHPMVLSGAAMLALASPSSAETISPRRLLEVADFSAPVVSPDGARVAFRLEQASVERNTYDSTWYVQALDGEPAPRRVADGGVPLRNSAGIPLPAAPVWSPDGRWIYYRARIDDKVDVWRAAADGSRAEPLTRAPGDVRDFSLGADGKTLLYSVGASREEVLAAEQAEYDQGIRIDQSVPIGQPLFRSGKVEGRPATQRFSGDWFDRESLLADMPDRWRSLDLETLTTAELDPFGAPTSSSATSPLAGREPEPWMVAVDPEQGRIAFLTRVGDGTGLMSKPDVELAMLPTPDASKPIVCREGPCIRQVITGLQWRPDSDEVVFTVTDPYSGHAQSIYRWNVHTGEVNLVVRSRGLLNGGRDPYSACGLSAFALACVAAEADGPPRLERIDFDSGQRQALFAPNIALAQDMAASAPARLLRWTDVRGRRFSGHLFSARKASQEAASPLFVTYYSCSGFLRGGVGDEWPLASLAQAGISSLCINQLPVYTLDAVERYGQGLSAVRSVVELLASEGKVDPKKVGMGGLSFGSEVTYWTVMQSDLLAAASITSVAVSPTYYLFGGLKGEAFSLGLRELWQLGAPDETPERWRLLSPAFNLDKIKTPILMQIPEQEYIDALDYAIPLIRSHRADLYVFPHEPHQKFQPRHKLVAYQRNLDWFRFWLQDYEDPDPAKREQYTHWRAMRERHAGE